MFIWKRGSRLHYKKFDIFCTCCKHNREQFINTQLTRRVDKCRKIIQFLINIHQILFAKYLQFLQVLRTPLRPTK
jgi:hypothetical protein